MNDMSARMAAIGIGTHDCNKKHNLGLRSRQSSNAGRCRPLGIQPLQFCIDSSTLAIAYNSANLFLLLLTEFFN